MEQASPVSGWRLILGYLGVFLVFEGIVTLLPLSMLVFYWDEWRAFPAFLIPGLCAIAIGLALYFPFVHGKPRSRFKKREDALLLTLVWLTAVTVGAFPFFIGGFLGQAPMSFTESFFESMSGYSATGFTVFPNEGFLDGAKALDYCAHLYLFHRATTHFFGGIGLVLIITSAISDRYNLQLYFAEGHNDRLLPNMRRSAKLTFAIYFAYIILGTLAFFLAGMDPFEGFCQSIAGLATGGFSTRSTGFYWYAEQATLGTYQGFGALPWVSPIAFEVIAMVLMVLGATNFILHTFLFRRRFKDFFKDVEFQLTAVLILVFTILMTCSMTYLYTDSSLETMVGLDWGTSFRYSIFTVISSMATTGFSNCANLMQLGEVAYFLMIILMVIGGGVGSTAGAIKQYRVAILAKELYWWIRDARRPSRLIHPHSVYRLGETREIGKKEVREAANFSLLYLSVLLVIALMMMFLPGIRVQEGLYTTASALSGTGLTIVNFFAYEESYGVVNYDLLLWFTSVAMLLGRLEILPVGSALVKTVEAPVEMWRERRGVIRG